MPRLFKISLYVRLLLDDELEEKSNSKAKQILGDDLSNEEKSDLKAAKTLGIEFIKKEVILLIVFLSNV